MNDKYEYEIKEDLDKTLRKLAKKSKSLFDAVMNKILQLIEKPYLGKPLKYELKGMRRVHIGHFVLVYEIDEKQKKIIFIKFTHHDDAY